MFCFLFFISLDIFLIMSFSANDANVNLTVLSSAVDGVSQVVNANAASNTLLPDYKIEREFVNYKFAGLGL